MRVTKRVELQGLQGLFSTLQPYTPWGTRELQGLQGLQGYHARLRARYAYKARSPFIVPTPARNNPATPTTLQPPNSHRGSAVAGLYSDPATPL